MLKSFHNGAVYRREDISPLIKAMASAPLTVDILTRDSLKPYQMSHAGCVWRCTGDGAHTLINSGVRELERESWTQALQSLANGEEQ